MKEVDDNKTPQKVHNETRKRKRNSSEHKEISKKLKDIDDWLLSSYGDDKLLDDFEVSRASPNTQRELVHTIVKRVENISPRNISNIDSNSDTSSDDCEIVSVSLNNEGQSLPKYRKIDVLADGNCLFWTVALAYLIPVKDDNNIFEVRLQKLFGVGKIQSNQLNIVQDFIQKYNILNNNALNNDTFKKLVTQDFRNIVCNYIWDNKEKFNFKDIMD